ncbi:MAG: hypothetical protein GVY26_16335 [Bacteroidetes bacterium]|nr:hypothetical protein [Bacteroidota bacterium]
MKKATAILLSVFVAWSAMQPCMDGQLPAKPEGHCPMEARVNPSATPHGCCASAAAAEQEQGCGDEAPEDDCTPFCSCQCCGTVFLQHLPEYKPVQPPLPIRRLIAYLTQHGQEFPHLIWQPPPFSA